MPETAQDFLMTRAPTSDRPLLGHTVLVVEDSRFASEAMRLLCLRSGARIRRADSLGAARRHLRSYRPSVLIVDLGLPDGRGSDLISELSRATPRVEAILAISGEDDAEPAARRAGADGFLAKPLTSLAAFQRAVLTALPDHARPAGPRPVDDAGILPDRVALADDLAHIADLLDKSCGPETLDYAARFLVSLARTTQDRGLERAAGSALRGIEGGGETETARLSLLRAVAERRAPRQVV